MHYKFRHCIYYIHQIHSTLWMFPVHKYGNFHHWGHCSQRCMYSLHWKCCRKGKTNFVDTVGNKRQTMHSGLMSTSQKDMKCMKMNHSQPCTSQADRQYNFLFVIHQILHCICSSTYPCCLLEKRRMQDTPRTKFLTTLPDLLKICRHHKPDKQSLLKNQ